MFHSMFRLSLLGVFMLSAIWGAGPLAAQDSGGAMKVVFLGDSITEAGAGAGGYVTLIREALAARHPDKKIEVIGAGISGNKVPDLQRRLEKDVLSHQPQIVVIYIGINDVWHSQSGKGTSPEDYTSGLKDIIGRIKQAGAKVIVCTPSVIGEKTDASNPLDKMLEDYAALSREVCRETACTLVDLRAHFIHELTNLNDENAAKGILTSDSVHLNEAGNEFVKDCLLPTVESVLTGKVMKHVVMFKFRADAPQADINRVCDAFAELPNQIKTIISYEAGSDISFENLNQGYKHCFIVTFANAEDRDAYLVDEAHQEFVKMLRPYVDGALVVDFWADK